MSFLAGLLSGLALTFAAPVLYPPIIVYTLQAVLILILAFRNYPAFGAGLLLCIPIGFKMFIPCVPMLPGLAVAGLFSCFLLSE